MYFMYIFDGIRISHILEVRHIYWPNALGGHAHITDTNPQLVHAHTQYISQ